MVRILEARHHDPFEVLGRHLDGDKAVVRAFIPHATGVRIEECGAEMVRIPDSDLFEWKGEASKIPRRRERS